MASIVKFLVEAHGGSGQRERGRGNLHLHIPSPSPGRKDGIHTRFEDKGPQASRNGSSVNQREWGTEKPF